MENKDTITGAEALLRALIAEGTECIFGYPGGQAIPVYDCLYDYRDRLRHVLVRHEQGAAHAAQGFARVSGRVGVALVTSGPGATNTITGVADAMLDSTPIVVITGQVPSPLLGTDAFQEVDVIGIMSPITKWAYQVRRADVLDISKDAQVGRTVFEHKPVDFIRSYRPWPEINAERVAEAAALIDAAERPFALVGQGVILSGAEQQLKDFLEKADIPAGVTMLGLSAMPSDFRLNKGMLGMHGNVGPNRKTNQCDVLIAIGMRFDDRVTGELKSYARQAKIIHLDIDASEQGKNVRADVKVLGDAKASLSALTNAVRPARHTAWIESFATDEAEEWEKVIEKEIHPTDGKLHMGEVVRRVSEATNHNAVLVTDVGQNQMVGVRYFQYTQTRSVVTSGGLGTMGFGLPAAIGAKLGAPDRTVCLFVGDGGLQMTIQELGTIMQERLDVKIILLNNHFLGMVRQWQELFFNERYSATEMENPDFVAIARAFRIASREVSRREELDEAVEEMMATDGPYLLVADVEKCGIIYPMVPAGASISNILM